VTQEFHPSSCCGVHKQDTTRYDQLMKSSFLVQLNYKNMKVKTILKSLLQIIP